MKRIVSIWGFTLVLVCASAGAERHQNPDAGFSFDVPAPLAQKLGPVMLLGATGESYTLSQKDNATIRIGRRASKTELEANKQTLVLTYGKSLIKAEPLSVGGEKAFRVEARLPSGMRLSEVMAKHGGDLFLLTYGASEGAYDRYAPVFDALVASFQFSAKAGPDTSAAGSAPVPAGATGGWRPFDYEGLRLKTRVPDAWGAPLAGVSDGGASAVFTLSKKPSATVTFTRMPDKRTVAKIVAESPTVQLPGVRTVSRVRTVAGKPAAEVVADEPGSFLHQVTIPTGSEAVVLALQVHGPRQDATDKDFEKMLSAVEFKR